MIIGTILVCDQHHIIVRLTWLTLKLMARCEPRDRMKSFWCSIYAALPLWILSRARHDAFICVVDGDEVAETKRRAAVGPDRYPCQDAPGGSPADER